MEGVSGQKKTEMGGLGQCVINIDQGTLHALMQACRLKTLPAQHQCYMHQYVYMHNIYITGNIYLIL